jgi:hypothetical protein
MKIVSVGAVARLEDGRIGLTLPVTHTDSARMLDTDWISLKLTDAEFDELIALASHGKTMVRK